MDNDVLAQPENAERPGWFLSWLKDVFLPAHKNPVDQQLEEFTDALEGIPDLDESIRKSLASTLTNEARIGGARQRRTQGGGGGHSPPPDKLREGRSPPPQILRQKMFPIW